MARTTYANFRKQRQVTSRKRAKSVMSRRRELVNCIELVSKTVPVVR